MAGLLRKAEQGNFFKGFSATNNLPISLLQFVDDTVIFCDIDQENLWCLKAILQSFELCSGMESI